MITRFASHFRGKFRGIQCEEMSSLKHLQPEVVLQIRSSFIIPCFAQAVEEVILNCIDANATSVEVRVNLSTLSFSVTDNGHGITMEDLRLLGESNGIFFRQFTNPTCINFT